MPDSSNPFLIPPPPPGMPEVPAQPVHAKPVTIVPPASMPPAAGTSTGPTERHAVSTAQAAASADKVVFFPTMPGAPRALGAAWRLVLADGSVLPVDRAMFLGRNPARTADRPGAELVPIDDPARSLSKTHALLELDGGRLWVHDLDSTNGVAVAESGAEPVIAEPGARLEVPARAELRLGTYVLRVEQTT